MIKMNTPPCTGATDETSETLLALVPQLFDDEDEFISDEMRVKNVQLLDSYLAYFKLPFQIIISGSSVEKTKLHCNFKGSDVDLMLILKNVTVERDALEYNKEYPAFVRVDLSRTSELGNIEKGEYLPTSYLRDFHFNKIKINAIIMNFIKYHFSEGKRMHLFAKSSVGLKNQNFLNPIFEGERGIAQSNDTEHQQMDVLGTLFRSLGHDLKNSDCCESQDVHDIIESVFASDGVESSKNKERYEDNFSEEPGCSYVSGETVKKSVNDSHSSVSFKDTRSIDIVYGVPVDGWPVVATEWITRNRTSPDEHIVNKIVQQGIHLVAKPLPGNTDTEFDFRLSFSLAEIVLAQSWNEAQRYTVAIIKACNNYNGPKGLTSYHIKTAVYTISEQEPMSFWRKKNLITCIHRVIDYLLFCVRRHFLPHYFVPQMNLFVELDDCSFSEMDEILQKMYHNPVQYVQGFIDPDKKNVVKKMDAKQLLDESDVLLETNNITTLYKQFLHGAIEHLFRSQCQEMQEEDKHGTVAEIAAMRSDLEKIGYTEHPALTSLFERVEEAEESPQTKSLLKATALIDLGSELYEHHG